MGGDLGRPPRWPLVVLLGGVGACVNSSEGLGGGGTRGGTAADGEDPPGAEDPSAADTTGTDDSAGGGDGPGIPPAGPPGGDACPGLSCLPCGEGRGCAEGTPLVEGTCCVEGDPLVRVGEGQGAEIVDLEVQGDLVVTCGGFGAAVEDISDPTRPRVIGAISPRCQNAAFGPVLPDGGQIVYLAHHGDTWVENPFLGVYRVDPARAEELEVLVEPQVLFEGLAWRDGWLYAAAHGGGLRVYSTDDQGHPSLETVVDGFDNALRPALHDEHLYVADGVGGLRVLSLADPASPEHVGQLEVPGMVRDVVVDGDAAALAMGGDGIEVLALDDPAAPVIRGHLETRGTAQAVAMDAEIIAIAAWSHVAVHDRSSLQLLATERTRPSPSFEQDLGVAMQGDGLVYVGEWESLHVLEHRPGEVAADLWIDEQLVSVPPDEAAQRVVAVRNRGYLDLDIDRLEIDAPFDVDEGWLRVPPQRARAFEISFVPPAPNAGQLRLELHSNDVDEGDPYRLPLLARQTASLDVGDTLTSDFAFVDPGGSPKLSGLEGQVVILAYFALF